MSLSDLLGALGGLVAGIVGAYIALRTHKPNLKVLNSQEQANLSKALKDAVDALLATSADRNKLELRVDELEAHREQRNKEMDALRVQNDDLQAAMIGLNNKLERSEREYTKQISALKDQVATWESRYNEIKDRYHKVVEAFANYLKARGETLPPDLAHLIGDSVKLRIKKGEQ